MSTFGVHRAIAERHKKFARALHQTNLGFHDWVEIGAFYSTLHYVDYHLAKIPNYPDIDRHRVRRDAIKDRNVNLTSIRHDYKYLEDRARYLRYGNGRVPFSNSQSADEALDKLGEIEAHVRSLHP